MTNCQISDLIHIRIYRAKVIPEHPGSVPEVTKYHPFLIMQITTNPALEQNHKSSRVGQVVVVSSVIRVTAGQRRVKGVEGFKQQR